MAQDPAFLVYYKDILVSCADWDADVLGWYFRLLSHQADKPRGLSPDLENLATLACVKFSQYERFKRCWLNQISHKFEKTPEGLLINLTQDGYLKDRREYKENQAHRGLVGYYVKCLRKLNSFSDDQINEITPLLFECLSTEKTKEENRGAFKRTLEAYMEDVNAIGIKNKKNSKGGMGEKEGWRQNPGQAEMGLELPTIKIGSTVELIRITQGITLKTSDVTDLWVIFKDLHFTGKKYYQDPEDTYSHFINWAKTQKIRPKNGQRTAVGGGLTGPTNGLNPSRIESEGVGDL